MASSVTTWPEPAPNWYEAKKVWKWGWKVHVFGFASLYILVGLYTAFNIFVQRNIFLKGKKLHALFLNTMLLMFSSARAAVLLWDPYASNGTSFVLLLLCVIIHGIAMACITSAFSVLLLCLLDSTKLSLAPPRFQKLRCLIGIWLINVMYVVVSDVTVAFHNSAKAMIFVCQVLFAIWGLVVSIGYAVAAYKIRKNLGSSRETSQHNNLSKETSKMHHLTIWMCVASVEGLCLFVMAIYMACGVNGVFNSSNDVKIWPWFGFQTFLRILELVMCFIIFVIALKSSSTGKASSTPASPQTPQGNFFVRSEADESKDSKL